MIPFEPVAIGTGGIARCVRCAKSEGAASPGPDDIGAIREGIFAAVRSWGQPPGPNVELVGYEPFSHPELPAIVRLALDVGVERLMIRTDAGALALGRNAEGALDAGVRLFEIVLLADGPTHDALTERPGLFDAACAGVDRVRDAAERAGLAIALCGLVPVCRHNAPYAPQAAGRLAALGCLAVHIDASCARRSDAVHVRAAVETAAANGCAASVSGCADPWAITYRSRPFYHPGGALA